MLLVQATVQGRNGYWVLVDDDRDYIPDDDAKKDGVHISVNRNIIAITDPEGRCSSGLTAAQLRYFLGKEIQDIFLFEENCGEDGSVWWRLSGGNSVETCAHVSLAQFIALCEAIPKLVVVPARA